MDEGGVSDTAIDSTVLRSHLRTMEAKFPAMSTIEQLEFLKLQQRVLEEKKEWRHEIPQFKAGDKFTRWDKDMDVQEFEKAFRADLFARYGEEGKLIRQIMDDQVIIFRVKKTPEEELRAPSMESWISWMEGDGPKPEGYGDFDHTVLKKAVQANITLFNLLIKATQTHPELKTSSGKVENLNGGMFRAQDGR